MTVRRARRVRLVPVSPDHQVAFLAAARRSKALHAPWVSPPTTGARFKRYALQHQGERHLGFLIFTTGGDLAGVVNVSEIVRGVFQSAYLGYCAFAPHEGQGYMEAGLRLVLGRCFRQHHLHRLEANIQPENRRSIRLARRLGSVREGYSKKYLKVQGRWRDHERWALTRERWNALRSRV